MKDPIKLSTKAKQVAEVRDKEEWMDRYLDQEYLEINNKLVSKTCLNYNPKLNPMCRSCRFFTSSRHQQKFSHPCPIWLKVFGNTLREFIKKMTLDGLRFNEKTMSIWSARKANVPENTRFKKVLAHPSAPKDRRNDGLPTVYWNE